MITTKCAEVRGLHPNPVWKHISHLNKMPHSRLQWKPSHLQTQDTAHLLSIDLPSLVNFIPCQLNEKKCWSKLLQIFPETWPVGTCVASTCSAELTAWLCLRCLPHRVGVLPHQWSVLVSAGLHLRTKLFISSLQTSPPKHYGLGILGRKGHVLNILIRARIQWTETTNYNTEEGKTPA